jgi:FK506-binding protein 1
MGVEKVVLRRGNGSDVPKKHDEVSMEYTGRADFPKSADYSSDTIVGWLYDESAPDNKGKQSVPFSPCPTA